VPCEFRLGARPAADPVAIDRAREIERRDDLIVQSLAVPGERRLDGSAAIADRCLEPARAFRPERGIADEASWKKAVEVEEGRL
jgi:hypothetical protein